MLPPTLLASLTAVGGTPTLTPTGVGALSPMMDPMKSMQPPARPPPMPTQPAIMRQHQQQPPIIIPMQQHHQPPTMPPLIPVQPIQPPPLIVGATAIPYIPSTQIGGGSIDLLGNRIVSPIELVSGGVGTTALPAPPTPPSGTPSRSMSLTDHKAPSIESPAGGVQVEWAIKSQSKLKYTQLFNTTDRTRSGYLTGAQARNLMVQTKLPQAILAQIWALSDMDSDGRLGCDEFVLAMYLCELSAQGDPIPAKLPLELIPPSFRKGLSRHGSAAGSRHGSVSSQSGGATAVGAALIDATGTDATAGLPNQCK